MNKNIVQTILSSTLIKSNTFQSLELSSNDWIIPSTSSIACIYFYNIHQWLSYEKQPNATFLNVQQLISTLKHLLDYYPCLSGTLKSFHSPDYKVVVENNDDKGGILFVSTEVNIFLNEISLSTEDFVNVDIIPETLQLTNTDNLEILFHVRHTRFQCGSVALGISLNHQLADAHSYFQLIKDWTRSYQQSDYKPNVCHQRSLLQLSSEEINELQSSNPNFNHRRSLAVKEPIPSSSKGIVVKNFRFSSDELAKMKSDALTHPSSNADYLSTFEVLTAHLYQHVMLARRYSPTSTSKLYISTNIRSRLRRPVLPSTYFGNAIMLSYLEVPISELIHATHLGLVATQIHDSIEKNNTEDIRTTLAWIQSQEHKQNILPTWNLDETDFTISAWNKMGMYSNGDFEKDVYPCRILLPPNIKYNGAANLLSTEINDGSIDVVLGLEIDEMKRLEENPNFRKYRL